MAANTISLKLLAESTSQRVLFAEAGKDFVDFLFNILSLPVGTVVSVFTKQEMVGCLGSLYHSLETMNDTYIQPAVNKDILLRPAVSNNAATVPPLLPISNSSKTIEIYRCGNNYNIRSCAVVNPQKKDSSSDEEGYVKGVITCMIMDDLVVQPMSAISCITLLNKFDIKDIGVLEEKTIDVGMAECEVAEGIIAGQNCAH
ncbi:putative DNA polymerase zeta catalytic subunit [Hibiscus syriacus]|uniref:DNA polymerase zeta catalytic subunit n=1 Tax=Hibiscus syriacus TaxID=106335 RepID=A0A6A2YDU4_HIBSY|nr:uncharacterized protein LOC120172757 [Hibiscus syriacus]KAE8671967.1 putative DNA polymerase zeta catalytic subunit [Hibiscus syriacus]